MDTAKLYKIQDFRIMVGVSQNQMARELTELYAEPGTVISSGTISRLENQRHLPRVELYVLINAWAEIQCEARGHEAQAYMLDWSDLLKPEHRYNNDLVVEMAQKRVEINVLRDSFAKL